MKRFLKLKNLIINNKELLLGIIVGLMLSSTAVFAVIKYASNNVLYRNTSSHLNATNVQAAIDELYTTCTNRPYTLTADSKGGTIPATSGWSINGSTATKTVIFNGTYGTLPEPTKGGHTFVGWFTKESGGTQIISSTKYRIAGNSTIHAHWNADTYTATFYYQSNTASGGATVDSKTASCTVSSESSCTVDIPAEVINSGGAYNNKYVGLSTSTGNMTEGVSGSATTVTLSANTNYYSLYRTAITLAYPTSESAATTKTVYQNQWFTTNTAMATTVLSTSPTGTSSNATAGSLVSGYSLVGFSASTSTNTATWTEIDGVRQSDSNKASTRNVYQIENKEETITAKFYYNDNTTCGGTTLKSENADVSKVTFLRCTSTTAAGTSVNTGELSVPSVVTGSKGPYNGTYVNVASSVNSMTPATVNVSTLTYYAFYRSEVTRYYASSTTVASNDTLYRNEVFTSTTAMKTVLSTTSTGTTTNATPRLAVSGYDTLVGFNTSSSKNVANSGETIAELTTTCNNSVFEIDKKTESISATFYYSSSSDGTKADDSFSGTRTTFLRPTGSTAAGTSISQGEIDLSRLSAVAPYGTSQLGWGYNANSMSTTTVNTSRTAYYAIYQTSGIRINYYNGSEYSTRTDIYRNGFYGSSEKYTMVLASSATGSGNYTTAGGPNGSTWNGLSTGADSVPEYSTVSEAASSSTTTFYTVYKYLVNYNKGVNISSVGTNMDSCNINSTGTSTGTTTCTVQLPTINPNSGYTSVGWNTTSGATTGTAPGNSYTINLSPTNLYANAYPTVSYNAGATCTGATGMPASQIKIPNTDLTLSTTEPTCSGKVFLGWSTTSNALTSSIWYDGGAAYTTNQTLTLYAQFYDVNSLENSYTQFVQGGQNNIGDFDYERANPINSNKSFAAGTIETFNLTTAQLAYILSKNFTYKSLGTVGYSVPRSQRVWKNLGGYEVDSTILCILSLYEYAGDFSQDRLYVKKRDATNYSNDSIATRIDRLLKIRDVALTYDDFTSKSFSQDNVTVADNTTLTLKDSNNTQVADSGYSLLMPSGFSVSNATNNGGSSSRVHVQAISMNSSLTQPTMRLGRAYVAGTDKIVKTYAYYMQVKSKTSSSSYSDPESPAIGTNSIGLSRFRELNTLNTSKNSNDYFTYDDIDNVQIYISGGSATTPISGTAWTQISDDLGANQTYKLNLPSGGVILGGVDFSWSGTDINKNETGVNPSRMSTRTQFFRTLGKVSGTDSSVLTVYAYPGNNSRDETEGHNAQVFYYNYPIIITKGSYSY